MTPTKLTIFGGSIRRFVHAGQSCGYATEELQRKIVRSVIKMRSGMRALETHSGYKSE